MIVRILGGEGQFDISGTDLDRLNAFDEALEQALERGDEDTFRSALHDLVAMVRQEGRPLPPDALVDSPMILPHPEASLSEIKELLSEDGGVLPDLS